MNDQLQAIATVLSLINPAICATIFTKLEAGRDSHDKVRDVFKAMFASFVGGKQQGGFLRDTLTRFMGLIVIAMGVQFGLTGFKSFMN